MSALRDLRDLPEAAPLLDALARGTKASKLRQFAAACPRCERTLVEVYPSTTGQLVISRYHLGVVDVQQITHEFRNMTIDVVNGQTTTVTAGGLLEHLPTSIWVRCCGVVGVESAWVRGQLENGARRAVVPTEFFTAD